MTRPEARPAQPHVLGQFEYRPTLGDVLGALADAAAYEAERVAIEVEIFGHADDDGLLFAA